MDTTPTDKSSPTRPDHDLWAVVLAAGEGTKLAPVTRLLYGHDVPKQFAALDGEKTFLQRTMDRLSGVVAAKQTVVVVAKHQRVMAEEQLGPYEGAQIIQQPENLGTGPGVLLPLSVVKAQAPGAVVIVTPADQYVRSPEPYGACLWQAVAAARGAVSGLAVVGAEPDRAASDLGWIVPQPADLQQHRFEVGGVDHFVEKPRQDWAEELFRLGALWNTKIVVGAVEAFWRQGRRHMPSQTLYFDKLVSVLEPQPTALDTPIVEHALARIYASLCPADFGRSILENVEGLAVASLRGAGWCDCGTPERLLACLEESAKPPLWLKWIVSSATVSGRRKTRRNPKVS